MADLRLISPCKVVLHCLSKNRSGNKRSEQWKRRELPTSRSDPESHSSEMKKVSYSRELTPAIDISRKRVIARVDPIQLASRSCLMALLDESLEK